MAAALWLRQTGRLPRPAHKGNVTTCTRLINGELNGLAHRLAVLITLA
ncbi:hypothetical protein VQH23_10580 [Pararoseomonas sp. SCSIO 73927]